MKYKNNVSHGHFCSVTLDLRNLWLRTFSSSFDWIMSSLESVVKLLDNKFSNYILYDNMEQSKTIRTYYQDFIYKIQFFYDFSKFKTFEP